MFEDSQTAPLKPSENARLSRFDSGVWVFGLSVKFHNVTTGNALVDLNSVVIKEIANVPV